MTEEQKDILISRMLDAPSLLSDQELELIMHDEDLRDIYELSATIEGATRPQPAIDVDEEWAVFRKQMLRKPSAIRRLMRVAAIFLGVLLVSALMVRFIDNLLQTDQPPLIAMTKPAKAPEVKSAPDPITTIAAVKEQSLPHPAQQRKRSVPVVSKAAPITEPEVESLNIDDEQIDEFLRIQQACIDNELALQTAELMADEFAQIQQLYEINGADCVIDESSIRKLAMQ